MAYPDEWNDVLKERDALRAENEKLKEIIDDFWEGVRKTLDDRCAYDEIHCGCVPILRNRIKQLETALRNLLPIANKPAYDIAQQALNEVRE